MHSGIEKLKEILSDVKTKKTPVDLFFHELWLAGATLPRPEMRTAVEQIDEFIRSETPVQPSHVATARLALGFIAFHEGNFESSIRTLFESQKLFSEIKDEVGTQCTSVMIGCNYRTLGELELALKYLFDAYEHLSRTGARNAFLGFCIYNLAEIYSETGQYGEALRFYELTEKLTAQEHMRNMHARAVNGIGVVYQHQKKYSLSLRYLSESLKLAEELENLPVKARALTDLGSYYFEMGEYTAAASCQEQALQIRNQLKIQNGAITNMVFIAQLSIKQNRPDDAIERLNQALAIAEEIKVKPKMFQIHQMLSDIYQSRGDLTKSLFHYKTFHLIREEVQHEDNEKKIKNLKLIFEAEQTKKENTIIKAQKQEIEIKNHQLQETIDELTITKISRKAKAITLIVGITLIVIEELLNYILTRSGVQTGVPSILAQVIIVLSLKPIDKAIETYLHRKFVLSRRKATAKVPAETETQ